MTPLEELAQAHLGELTEVEKKLFEQISQGNKASFQDDPIRADCLIWLHTARETKPYISDRGTWVCGVRIQGDLDFDYIDLNKPLKIEHSNILGAVRLNQAQLHVLSLQGTHLEALYAEGLIVNHDMVLRQARVRENVQLSMVSVGGNLDCGQCEIQNKSQAEIALRADSAKVSGSVYLHGNSAFSPLIIPFMGQGEVRLAGAVIEGELDCSHSKIINSGKRAFWADDIRVGASAFFNGAKLIGKNSLVGARIGGDLSFEGCQLCLTENSAGVSTQRGGGASPPAPFPVEGDPHGDKTKPVVLRLDAVEVRSDLFFRKKFSAVGLISLVDAKINHSLCLKDIKQPEKMALSLKYATVRTLVDDDQSWPESGYLWLDGLTYQTLDREVFPRAHGTRARQLEKHRLRQHLVWLRRQHQCLNYRSYDVLATVLKNGGEEDLAKHIQLSKYRDRRKAKKLSPLNRIWEYLQDWMIGYGFYPERAVWVALCFIVMGWAVFYWAYRSERLIPAGYSQIEVYENKSLDKDIDKQALDPSYPRFHAFFYSLDTFTPILDLQQDRHWHLQSGNREKCPESPPACLDEMVRWYLRLHIISGWVVTSFLVVALTGLVRKQEP